MISFVHTDFFNYYKSHFSLKNKTKLNSIYVFQKILDDLNYITKNKIIIPTYNYDFSKTKNFNYKNDKSQVGSFSEFFRKKFINSRTLVPFFSTCNNCKLEFYKKINLIDPFGPDSEFDYLYKNNGKILNFGASFAPTYIMYIERSLKNGALYRYKKIFKGQSFIKNKYRDLTLYYEVRPIILNIQYDLKKIRNLLMGHNILKIKKTKNNFNYEEIDAKKFKDLILRKIKTNPYFLLSKKTIINLKKNKFLNHKKFQIEQFE